MVKATGPKHRSDFILLTGFGWIFGYCALPWVAFWFGNFRYLILAFITFEILTELWFYLFIDESALWQLVNNKFDEAEKNIKKILLKNKKFISDDDLKEKMKKLKQHIELVIIIIIIINFSIINLKIIKFLDCSRRRKQS